MPKHHYSQHQLFTPYTAEQRAAQRAGAPLYLTAFLANHHALAEPFEPSAPSAAQAAASTAYHRALANHAATSLDDDTLIADAILEYALDRENAEREYIQRLRSKQKNNL